MATLEVSHTWDGEPLGESERCTVDLTAAAAGWVVEVEAPFHGDPAPSAPPGMLDGLWAFEVVELFVAAAGANDAEADYIEIEVSPHGHHLILRFAGVREVAARIEPVAVACRIVGDRWHGRLEVLGDAFPPEPWRANAFAMHGPSGSRRHLAAAPLPGPRPDFHQPARFPRFRARD